MIPIHYLLSLSGMLFAIGLYGALTRRNSIGILMSIEIMYNAGLLNLIALARWTKPTPVSGLLGGQVSTLFILAVAASEVAIGLAIIVAVYRDFSTIDTEKVNLMKW